MVKVRGHNSNWKTVKQPTENGQKKTRVTKTRPVLRHWCQASRVQGCGMVLNSTGHISVFYGRLPTNWFRLIMNISNRSRDCAWRRGGTTDVTNIRTCHIFTVCLAVFLVFLFEFRPRTFTIELYKKKSLRSDLMILKCNFPSTLI